MTNARSQPTWLTNDGITTLSLLASFLLLCMFFSVQTEFFFSSANAINLARTLAIVGIAAIGMTLALISGGVDISVGSVAALAGVLVSYFWQLNIPLGLSTLLALGCCTLVGLVNGLIITVLKINPLITTLATFSIVRGLAFFISEGPTNQLNNAGFTFLGRGSLAGFPFSLVLMLSLYVL
ncbi:MAG: hypothetical protein AAF267_02805, partial [Deinococcota bacterium]